MNDNRRSVIVDPAPDETEYDQLPDQETAKELVHGQPRQEPTQEDTRPEWIPDKFWDGDLESSARKLADSYGNLESDRGRLANEVGTLRHLVDQALDLKRTQDLQDNGGEPGEDSQPVTADDLLNDPDTAISRAVERATRPLTEKLSRAEQQEALMRFEQNHPTFREDLQDQQFQQWVAGSAYRQRLAQHVLESEKQGRPDFDAAEELWSGWEEVRQSAGTQDAPDEAEQVNEQREQQGAAIDRATLTTRGGAESDVSHKPIYSRAALVQKRINDPDGYYDPEFQRVIQQAYLEKRVR
jgi:hypothetical protein